MLELIVDKYSVFAETKHEEVLIVTIVDELYVFAGHIGVVTNMEIHGGCF